MEQQTINPWLFNEQPFTSDMIKNYAGFVYKITDLETNKVYIGKKFFWSRRKLKKTDKRRTKIESDWQKYFSSSDNLKAMVKEFGYARFKREIISLHTLERDVNYSENMLLFKLDVLHSLDKNGERLYLNENIMCRYFPKYVLGMEERSNYSNTVLL